MRRQASTVLAMPCVHLSGTTQNFIETADMIELLFDIASILRLSYAVI